MASKVAQLEKALAASVVAMDFEKAAKLRDEIKASKANDGKLKTLQEKLQALVSKQDFENAAQVRDQIKLLQAGTGSATGLKTQELQRNIQQLEKKLQQLVQQSEFEKAAELRDKITTLKQQVEGATTVHPKAKETKTAETKHKPEENERTVVISRIPIGAGDSDVLASVPGAQKVRMVHKEGWSSKLALVTCTTKEGAKAAVTKGNVVILGNSLMVKPGTRREQTKRKAEENEGTLVASFIPIGVKDADVLACFPGAKSLNMLYKKGWPSMTAFVNFATKEEAKAAAAKGGVAISGQLLKLRVKQTLLPMQPAGSSAKGPAAKKFKAHKQSA